MPKTIMFNGVPMTKSQLDDLASEAARAAENFETIWQRQKGKKN